MLVASAIETRETLLKRFMRARSETDELFALVNPNCLSERPIAERHRIIFYLGHLEAFDWNLMRRRLPGAKHFDSSLDNLFAFGIDPVGGGLPTDQPGDWPSQSVISDYNRQVRTKLDEALTRNGFWDGPGEETPQTLVNVAIEHRLMHAETLSYMLHQMSVENILSIAQAPAPISRRVNHSKLRIPSGSTRLGKSAADPADFGWDNEYEPLVLEVPEFTIETFKVTNGQFMDFVEAGGYRSREFWSDADWRWKEESGIEHPLFWQRDAAGWRYRAMFYEIPFPHDWPVYTSHAEACAYAAWKGKRLPTEAEWHRAAYGGSGSVEPSYPWGDQLPAEHHGYLDMRRWDPAPVNAFPEGRSTFGTEGMLGNGWEWTSSNFAPFPGFQASPCYPGYSANFFDGQHYVLKGGSPRTERCMLRRSFRNWFQPHYQYVYAGFRCVGR